MRPQISRLDSKFDDGPNEEVELVSKWSTFDYRQKQLDVLENYQPIWPWFFESEQYTNWKEGRRWQLRCYSEPGCGKTTLAAETARQLQHRRKQTQERSAYIRDTGENNRIAVFILFLSHPDHNDETIDTLSDPITALWRTVMRQTLEILLSQGRSPEVLNFFSMHDLESQDMPLELLQSRVNAALSRLFDQVFIVTDDLDHCTPALQAEFKTQFNRILRTYRADMKTGIFNVGQFQMPAASETVKATDLESVERADNRDRQRNQDCDVDSCEDPERPVLYRRCQTCLAAGIEFDVCQSCYDDGKRCNESHENLMEPYDEVYIQLTVSGSEMHQFVRSKIEDACKKSQLQRRLTEHLRDAVENNTVNTASGSLVIARTYVDHLFRSENHEELLGVLDHVAQPEERYFGRMMATLTDQNESKSLLAFQILYLISQASHETRNRRLDYYEILNALAALNIDSDEADHRLTLNEMLVICKGILTVSPGDKNLIQAFHADMEVYLYENQLECFDDLDMDMTELCLEALTANADLDTLDFTCDTHRQDFLNHHPFLVYASQCWGYHLVKNSTEESEENAYALLQDTKKLAASLYIACTSPVDGAQVFDIWPGSHSLHVCAFFNLIGQLRLAMTRDPQIDLDVLEPVHGRTPLIVACQHGAAGMVKELLDRGAKPDVLSRTHRSAVYEAVDHGFSNIVQLFIDAGHCSALNQKSLCGRTPLILSATQVDDTGIFELLVTQEEVDINTQDDDGRTALMHAILTGNVDAVDALLERDDIELHHRDVAGQTAMHLVASQADHEMQRKIFEFASRDAFKACLDVGDAAEITVLMAMVDLMDTWDDDEAAEEIPQIVEMLIESGCRIDCTDNAGRGLMHHACTNDAQLPLLNLLHDAGLSPNADDNQGWTPLHSACAHGTPAILKRLLEFGAEPLRTDMPSSLLPSDVATLYNNPDLAETMRSFEEHHLPAALTSPITPSLPLWSRIATADDAISSLSGIPPADLSAPDPHLHHTALHKAVRSHSLPLVTLLLSSPEIALDPLTVWNETPLHLAARSTDHPGIVRALLEAGADPAVADLAGMTPLAVARARDPSSDCTLLLVEHNGGPVPDGDDLQAMLAAAVRAGRREAVEGLLASGASLLSHDARALLPVHVAEEVRDEGFRGWVRGRHREAIRGFGG